jgi:hypothetical protein
MFIIIIITAVVRTFCGRYCNVVFLYGVTGTIKLQRCSDETVTENCTKISLVSTSLGLVDLPFPLVATAIKWRK